MALNLAWLGFIWGTAVGILIGDVLYFLTDWLAGFLIFIPFSLVGYILGKRALKKYGSLEEMQRRNL